MIWRMAAGALVALSLGLKLHGNFVVPGDDVHAALHQVAAGLDKQGWSARVDLTGRGWLHGARGPCLLTARVLDPHGTNNTAYIGQLAPKGRVRYAWDGQWRDSLPRFAPLMTYYFKREIARQGIAAARHGVWIVALSPGCAGQLDAGFSLNSIPMNTIETLDPAQAPPKP